MARGIIYATLSLNKSRCRKASGLNAETWKQVLHKAKEIQCQWWQQHYDLEAFSILDTTNIKSGVVIKCLNTFRTAVWAGWRIEQCCGSCSELRSVIPHGERPVIESTCLCQHSFPFSREVSVQTLRSLHIVSIHMSSFCPASWCLPVTGFTPAGSPTPEHAVSLFHNPGNPD